MTHKDETNEVEATTESNEPPPAFQSPDPAPRKIVLEISQPNRKDRVKLIFENQPLVIGRGDEDNPIEVDVTRYGAFECGVSRQHVALTWENNELYVMDLGSTNGTRLNGFNLEPHHSYRLRHGDEIEMGQLQTIVRFVR